MNSHVNFQSAGARVLLVTYLTSEWPLSSVSQLMGLQVTLGDETLAAVVTLEWALASVGSHVGLKITRLTEFFETAMVGTNQDLCLILDA